jgi:predicted transcriptional regulator
MRNSQNKLRDVRVSEGLKITELSRLCKVNEKTIREVEKGRSRSTEVTKRKIVKGLNDNPNKTKIWTYEEILGSE